MKKYLILVIVLFLLPISVLARQETKERLFQAIEDIRNVQVDDTIIIRSMKVEEKSIKLEMEEDGEKVTRFISYDFRDNYLIFNSGYVILEKANNNIKLNPIENNQYAFYLYSILESLSTAPYDEENYYNNIQITKKLENLSLTEKQDFWTTSMKKLQYYNVGTTFGLQLIGEEVKDNQVKINIYYQYFIDGEDTILVNPIVEAGKNDILTNPETGNYSFFITVLLLIVIGLAAYTYWEPTKKKS